MITLTQSANTMEKVHLDSKQKETAATYIMLTNIYPHPTFCNLHQSAFVAESEQEMRWFWRQSLDFGQVHFETFLRFFLQCYRSSCRTSLYLA